LHKFKDRLDVRDMAATCVAHPDPVGGFREIGAVLL